MIEAGGGRRWDLGDGTRVDALAAAKLARTARAEAAALGFDKVSAAAVLLDAAIAILREHPPPWRNPAQIRNLFERALRWHATRRS